jgi:CheY-like chemotaxis protein
LAIADSTDLPRVLIADDERIVADTLRTILNRSGFEAASVYGGQDALDMARVWPPEIFLSDVVMPEVSGIEAAIQICKMIPECRVLLISGNAEMHHLTRLASLEGHHFPILQKPVPPQELLALLRSLTRNG